MTLKKFAKVNYDCGLLGLIGMTFVVARKTKAKPQHIRTVVKAVANFIRSHRISLFNLYSN